MTNPPVLQPSTGSDAGMEPLTVLFSFLSRADTTPLDQRSRAHGHIIGKDGLSLADPAVDPSASAFASDPNINFEQWGEYWRKVHGVRFLHSDELDDQKRIDLLLRYDQIQRVAAGPTSLNPPPYHPPLDDRGQLFDTIIGHVEPYRRPAWDGVAYLNFASLGDLGAMLGSDRVRRKILPEDQAIFRDLAPVLARQFVIIPNPDGNDAITLVKTHVRREDMDRDTFQRLWLKEHAAVVLRQPETSRFVKRYVQLHNIGPAKEGEPFYHSATKQIDGVTVMSFASMKDVETFLSSDSYVEILQDERSIAMPEAGEYWTGVTLSVVDRTAPERVTARGE